MSRLQICIMVGLFLSVAGFVLSWLFLSFAFGQVDSNFVNEADVTVALVAGIVSVISFLVFGILQLLVQLGRIR